MAHLNGPCGLSRATACGAGGSRSRAQDCGRASRPKLRLPRSRYGERGPIPTLRAYRADAGECRYPGMCSSAAMISARCFSMRPMSPLTLWSRVLSRSAIAVSYISRRPRRVFLPNWFTAGALAVPRALQTAKTSASIGCLAGLSVREPGERGRGQNSEAPSRTALPGSPQPWRDGGRSGVKKPTRPLRSNRSPRSVASTPRRAVRRR